MTQRPHTTPTAAHHGNWLGGLLDSLGDDMSTYIERRSHREEIARLKAKSDTELATLGLARDRIAQNAFRDIYYI